SSSILLKFCFQKNIKVDANQFCLFPLFEIHCWIESTVISDDSKLRRFYHDAFDRARSRLRFD
ncbi:unnamed protein product, partial [Arabidopsis halleri]